MVQRIDVRTETNITENTPVFYERTDKRIMLLSLSFSNGEMYKLKLCEVNIFRYIYILAAFETKTIEYTHTHIHTPTHKPTHMHAYHVRKQACTHTYTP